MDRKEAKRRQTAGTIIGVIFGLIAAVCITLTVSGNERRNGFSYNEAYFDKLESAYQAEVRQVLADYGMGRSGINLTKITEADGTRSYRLVVCGSQVERMDEEQAGLVIETLCEISFPEQGCKVNIILSGL